MQRGDKGLRSFGIDRERRVLEGREATGRAFPLRADEKASDEQAERFDGARSARTRIRACRRGHEGVACVPHELAQLPHADDGQRLARSCDAFVGQKSEPLNGAERIDAVLLGVTRRELQ
jgi:hypothetical protein